MSAAYAKICPKRIEATCFGVLGSVQNFRLMLRSWVGSFINSQWVGVTSDDLSNYWILVTLGYTCAFLPLLFLWLIPSREEVNELQESLERQGSEIETRRERDEAACGEGSDEESASLLDHGSDAQTSISK